MTEKKTTKKKVTKTSSLPVEVKAGGSTMAIIPQGFNDVRLIAQLVIQSGHAPKGMNKPEQAALAIMAGLEVGMAPMQALQSIAVINGRTTIWGDGALGLVQSSGLLDDFHEYFEGEGDQRVAFCRCNRKGQPTEILQSFSVEQAKKARLAGKQGPWTDYPDRMLQMRARAFALRDGFADVLKGLSVREEVRDYHKQDTSADTVTAEELIDQAAEGEEIEDAEFSEATTSGEEPESPTPESGDEQDADPAGSTNAEDGPPTSEQEPSSIPPLGDGSAPAEDAPETPVEDLSHDAAEKLDEAVLIDDVKPSGGKQPSGNYASAAEMMDVIDVCQTATAIKNSVARMNIKDLFPPDQQDVLDHAEKRKAELAK